jgi:UDPglucose--hexose-1-phosphate uridylyltransferase
MAWEQRWHPLRREWVVITSHRDNRPWNGERLGPADDRTGLAGYVADCQLCPGNERISGQRNAAYSGVFTFDNDHPCVSAAAPVALEAPPGIYRNRPATGASRVVCFSPRHNVTLAELPHARHVELLGELQRQYRELGARDDVRHVLVFENKGEVVGVSNPHPHCQIYATNFVFRTIELEADASAEYLAANGRVLFQDIIGAEEADERRVLASCGSALAFVPYFARYAYETFVAPRGTHASIADLSPAELRDLAAVLGETLVRMDNLWRMPFPYVLAFHQAPVDGAAHPGFHFHIEIHTPLRKPGLLKYLAGPEIGGGNFLNDTAPEDKAAELRAAPSTHYRAGASA